MDNALPASLKEYQHTIDELKRELLEVYKKNARLHDELSAARQETIETLEGLCRLKKAMFGGEYAVQ